MQNTQELNTKGQAFTMDSYFLINEAAISTEECELILKHYEDIKHLSKKNKRVVEHVDKVINEVLLDDLGGVWTEILKSVDSKVSSQIQKYLDQFKTIGLGSYKYSNTALWEQRDQEYSPLHYDKEWIQAEDGTDQYRNFLCLLYLNDDYENGELIFPLQKKVIKPKAGMLVVFPTSFMFPHQTTPATGNTRYLMRLNYSFDKATLKTNDLKM